MSRERAIDDQQPLRHPNQPVNYAISALLGLPKVSGPTSSPSSLYSPSASTPSTPRSRAIAGSPADLTVLFLLLVGVGCTLSWTAVVFGSAVYYNERYGRAALLYLSAAAYVPGVLVAGLHAAVDGWMYRRLGARRWTQLRMCGGLLLVILLTLAVPCIPDDTSSTGEVQLCALTFLLGAASALPNCCALDLVSGLKRQYIVALTAGTQLSGLVSLALTFLTGLDGATSDRSVHRLFMMSVALTTAASLCAAVLLQWKSQQWQYVMSRRHFFSQASVRESEVTPLLAQPHIGTERWQLTHIIAAEDGEQQSDEGRAVESTVWLHSDTVHAHAPTQQLTRNIDDAHLSLGASSTVHSSLLSILPFVWQPCLSLFLTASTSVSLASLYSFTPSTSPTLLLVLVYTRLTLDLVGRLILLLPSVSPVAVVQQRQQCSTVSSGSRESGGRRAGVLCLPGRLVVAE